MYHTAGDGGNCRSTYVHDLAAQLRASLTEAQALGSMEHAVHIGARALHGWLTRRCVCATRSVERS